MANAIPLLEGTNASGGFLVPTATAASSSAAASTASRRRVDAGPAHPQVVGKREKLTEYVGRPDRRDRR
jgi:hypothetical protein